MFTMLQAFALSWLQPGSRRVRWLAIGVVATLVIMVLFSVHPSTANAAPGFNFNPVSQIQTTASGWWAAGKTAATRLFVALIVIEITVFGFQMALFRDNLGEFFGGVALKVITIGLFLWFINQADWIFPSVFNSLDQAGGNITTGHSEPSDIANIILNIGIGLGLIYGAVATSHATDMGTVSAGGPIVEGNAPLMGEAMTSQFAHFWDDSLVQILGFMIIMAVAVVVLQYVIIEAEAAMVMAGGVIFLGFSGTKFTLPFAQGYMSYAINVGAKLLALHLGLAVASDLSNDLVTIMTGTAIAIGVSDAIPFGAGAELQVLAMGYVAFETLVMASIIWFIPNLAGSFLSGQSTMSGSQMMGNMMGAASGSQMLGAGLQGASNSGHSAQGLAGLAAGGGGSAGAQAPVGGAGQPGGNSGGDAPSVPTAIGSQSMSDGANPAMSAAQMTPGSATNVGSAYTAGISGAGGAQVASAGAQPLNSGASTMRIGGGGGGAPGQMGGADAGVSSGSAAGPMSSGMAATDSSTGAAATAAISTSGDGGLASGNIGASGAGAAPISSSSADASPASASLASAGPASASSANAGPSNAGPSNAGPSSAGPASAGPVSSGSVSSGMQPPTINGRPNPMASAGAAGGGSGGVAPITAFSAGEIRAMTPEARQAHMDAGVGGVNASQIDAIVETSGRDALSSSAEKQEKAAEQQQQQSMAYAMSGLAQGVPHDGAPPSAVQVRLGLPDKL